MWPTSELPVSSLLLDPKNPRLGRDGSISTPKEIIHHLFAHDKALEVVSSIATRGYFPNEPLLAIKQGGEYVVIEGNRRLAALKALKDPTLLEGTLHRHVERLSNKIEGPTSIKTVPVTVAPSRRATDQQIAGRHVGTPVLAWQAENRARFILDKLEEGYSNSDLQDLLGFSPTDVQKARQTKAVSEMARSLQLAPGVKARLDSPRAKIFSTLERVFDSSVGRDYLRVVPDSEYGIKGTTTPAEFIRGFSKLITDVALGRQSSRTLNTNEDIRKYFESWRPEERPAHKAGSFVPGDVITGSRTATSRVPTAESAGVKAKKISKTVIPRSFKIVYGNDRLVDIRGELTRIKRMQYPNAGAILLRVFFELAAVSFLERTGELKKIVEGLKAKAVPVPHGVPTMRQLAPALVNIAKKELSSGEATRVEKALRYDAAAPFTISDLHAFVHQVAELPSDRDILQFWVRTEPLFRLMLQTSPGAEK
jgi:hypothetical protein